MKRLKNKEEFLALYGRQQARVIDNKDFCDNTKAIQYPALIIGRKSSV